MRIRIPKLLLPLAALIGLAALIYAVSRPGRQHTVVATFDSATNLVSGARVTAGGVPVGSVGEITLDHGLADVTLNLTDPHVWPLHTGTHAVIRWGGSVSYSNRYVELLPGPASDPALADGARLPTTDTVTPVEFDQLFNIFTPPARAALGGVVDHGAATFSGQSGALHQGLTEAGPALTSIEGVLQQLGADPAALETLVSTGAQTAAALRSEQPQLQGLVTDAAGIFHTIATHAERTQATLAALPGALDSADTALTRLDPTLTRLGTLVSDIRPGAARLRTLATPLGQAITTLGHVAPQLNGTLADLQHGAPAITSLLTTAKPVLTASQSALRDVTPMAACLLPYGPEIAGFITTWGSFASYFDNVGHWASVLAQAFPFPNDGVQSPSQLVSTFGNLGYALLRPPGYGAGTPHFLPQCGVGPDALNPAADPEAR